MGRQQLNLGDNKREEKTGMGGSHWLKTISPEGSSAHTPSRQEAQDSSSRDRGQIPVPGAPSEPPSRPGGRAVLAGPGCSGGAGGRGGNRCRGVLPWSHGTVTIAMAMAMATAIRGVLLGLRTARARRWVATSARSHSSLPSASVAGSDVSQYGVQRLGAQEEEARDRGGWRAGEGGGRGRGAVGRAPPRRGRASEEEER